MADGYDTDFYAWAETQAQALRNRGAGGNALDYDNLAEEIDGLARSEKRACTSLIEQILIHLLKLDFWADPDCVRGWRKEVKAFRRDLLRELSPTLRARLPEELQDLYRYARETLVDTLDEQDLVIRLPESSPYSWDDVLGRGEDWMPEPGACATT